MKALDELVKEAAEKGLTHLTMWPTHSADRKKLYWYCRATPSTQHSYVQSHSEDVLEALTQVLEALPKAPKRTKAEKITMTVSDAEPEFDVATPEETEQLPRKKGGLNPEWGI